MHKGHLRQPVHAVYISDGLASSMLCYGNTAIVMSLVDTDHTLWLMQVMPICLLIMSLFIMGLMKYSKKLQLKHSSFHVYEIQCYRVLPVKHNLP